MKMTKNNNWQINIALTLGLFAFLYIASVFDRITRIIPFYDTDGSQYFAILRWFFPFATLFIVSVGLTLFWLMQSKLHQRKWVEVLYLSVGLFIVFSYNLSNIQVFRPLLSRYLFGSSVPLAILMQNNFWLTTYVYMAGSLVGVIGLALLVFPRTTKEIG
jgi:hypothetical protein